MTVPILLTAFCRAELTRNSIISLLERFPEVTLIVSQDGRIPGFFEEDHELTREMLKSISSEYPQLRVNLRRKNVGLTGHLIEMFDEIFQTHSNVIFLEEDMWLDSHGLAFLTEVKNDSGLSHRTAFSTTKHPSTSNPLDYRLSYFPEQWGVAINQETYGAFKDEVNRRTVERSLVRKVIRNSGYSSFRAEVLSDFWTQLLRQEIDSPHAWDATLQLALWRHSSPSRVSMKSFVKDLGGGEGSITKRFDFPHKGKLHSDMHNLQIHATCTTCEKLDASRRGYSPLSQIRNRIRIRSRFQQFISLRKYL